MTRQQLEHVIRAAAGTVNVRDIIVIGSQAILGSHPDAPNELTQSLEADVYPKNDPQLAIVIDGSIGELSLFHSTFGYYAHGVGESTAILPQGWRERLIKIQTPGTMGAIGWCLEVDDLAVSKLAAGREKDFAYVETMVLLGIASSSVIHERLEQTPGFQNQLKPIVLARLESWGRAQR